MYLPSLENLTSEIDEMISEKKDLFDGSSSSSNSVRIGEEGGMECMRQNLLISSISGRYLVFSESLLIYEQCVTHAWHVGHRELSHACQLA